MAGNIRLVSAGPLSVLAILLLLGLVIFLIPLLTLGIIGAAFTRLGLSWIAAVALVLLILAGSFVNIPLHRIRRDTIPAILLDSAGNDVTYPFTAPAVWDTVISINLGGGILPVCIAVFMVYQLVKVMTISVLVPVVLCASIVLAVSFISANEIAGVGIRVPFFIPALTAILAGLLLSGGTGLTAAATALVGGTFGTIAGGNLAHLFHVRDLGIPEVSIGGSGTFGAVFLCCVIPAIIA